MATHCSILAWRIPWTENPGRLQSMGPQRVGHAWLTNTFTFIVLMKQDSAGRKLLPSTESGSESLVLKPEKFYDSPSHITLGPFSTMLGSAESQGRFFTYSSPSANALNERIVSSLEWSLFHLLASRRTASSLMVCSMFRTYLSFPDCESINFSWYPLVLCLLKLS